MKFIYVSDLHSNKNLYNKLDLLVDKNRPDMIIIGGDIFNENVKPILTLHGHIHEAPSMLKQWAEKIGETISINPGSLDSLNAVKVEIDNDGKIIGLCHNVYGELKL